MAVVNDTIVALATGNLPSGIAIIRVSGSACKKLLGILQVKVPTDRRLTLANIVDSDADQVIDQCMVFYTCGPDSFTGEDIVEFHLHGSVAVVQKLLGILTTQTGVRLAEAGEFTRRAFENGLLDLSEVEGLSDLLRAETEGQRQQAVARYSGGLTQIVDVWRNRLVQNLSLLEAHIDFSDEEDVAALDVAAVVAELSTIRDDLKHRIEGFKYGRIVRKGFRVGVIGSPNVGKSSIINALTRSNRAIVTDEMGTTRDIQEVQLDLGGRLVLLLDSAGIRQALSKAEQEGIRRSMEMEQTCDLLLWISAPDIVGSDEMPDFSECKAMHVLNKSDLAVRDSGLTCVCAANGDVAALEELICREYDKLDHTGSISLISRQRDVDALENGRNALDKAISGLDRSHSGADLELVAEDFRHCIFTLQRLVGRVDAEDVLDRVFSGFCIGK